ncbi:hypothetical protein BgiBS90_001263 [Biomphalaria glabrata]|nr:hypothetical protein BgiBS90_001263 [Biomphalaria glabrata]
MVEKQENGSHISGLEQKTLGLTLKLSKLREREVHTEVKMYGYPHCDSKGSFNKYSAEEKENGRTRSTPMTSNVSKWVTLRQEQNAFKNSFASYSGRLSVLIIDCIRAYH